MKKNHLLAVVGVSALMVFMGLIFRPVQVARAATGCTCPTGCSTVTTITAPFSYSGAGEFCWQSTNLGSYIQSWGADVVQVTGVDYTNQYVVSDQMLRDTTGTYYIYYKSSTANGNFSATGTSDVTNCHAAWCSAAQYGQMRFGAFTMFNNVWGAASGAGQTIQANSPSDWSVFATFPETGGVKSYPNASLDMATSGKSISTLGSCTSSFAVTVPSTGSYETAYDIWVPSEIMIWMNKNGLVGPIASSWNSDGTPVISAANVTVGGSTWDVYHGGANVVSFVRQGNETSGTVDILALLNWTKSQGWIGDGPLAKFQVGFEITSSPGGLTFTMNNYSISCGGLGGAVTPQPSSTPIRTNTPGAPTVTPTRTATATNTPLGPTASPTRSATPTNTPQGATLTPTRSATPTNIPLGPTVTPTRTSTATTMSPTSTPGSAACSPVTSTVTAPFTFDGAGTFCWQIAIIPSYTNNWNLANLTINGVNFTGVYVATASLPAKINGFYYIGYTSSVAWGHFETK